MLEVLWIGERCNNIFGIKADKRPMAKKTYVIFQKRFCFFGYALWKTVADVHIFYDRHSFAKNNTQGK